MQRQYLGNGKWKKGVEEMRLIDADALIEELHHMIEGDADLRKDYEYMGIDDCIRSIPTAYDVEKVVAEVQNVHLKLASQTARIVGIIRKGRVE